MTPRSSRNSPGGAGIGDRWVLLFWRLLLVVAIVGLWEWGARTRKLEFYISKPTDIASKLTQWVADGTLSMHMSATIIVAILGFLVGSAAGMIVGLVLGRAERLARVLDPFLMGIYSMPKVALAPVFVLWFGVDMDMKVIFVASVVFFLVFLNTYTGVRNVSRDQIAILRLMGAREHHLATKVILPSALVWVFTGLRLSVPYALIGTILGEMMATNRGLGFLLANTAATFDSAGTFATLVAIIAMSMSLNAVVRLVERAAMPWREAGDAREVSL
jgi:NitT/TauT family transport system permease protein